MNIRFFIIVPVYNVEKYLQECIDSVLGQTYRDFRLILVDDGSTDSSREICEYYSQQDDRVCFKTQDNLGAHAARCSGVKEVTISKDNYVIFIDADDYCGSDMLESLRRIIGGRAYDMILFNHRLVSGSPSVPLYNSDREFDEESKRELFRFIIGGNRLNNLWNKSFNSTLFSDTDLRENEIILKANDLFLLLPLFVKSNSFYYLNKGLYFYRVRENSITAKYAPDHIDSLFAVKKSTLGCMKEMGYDSDEDLALFYKYFIIMLMNYVVKSMRSKNSFSLKVDICERIKENDFYVELVKNLGTVKLSIPYRVLVFLFRKNYYRSILWLSSLFGGIF